MKCYVSNNYNYDIQFLYLQGIPGEKGQKGDLGQPAIDVFQAVKVWCFVPLFILYQYDIH